MKIINVTPGLLPIPPNGWGAVEKIIWETHLCLKNLGHDAHICYLDDVPKEADIVHIHVANLANKAHERGIEYYFTMHDHHAYLYGKDSHAYKENLLAIKRAKRAFVPAKYLVDWFEGIPEYFSHGVNTEFFKPGETPREHKLLCVANNGFIHNQAEDRKGFGFAIEAAKKLGLPITIVGPENNRNYFDKFPPDYDKLEIIYNATEEELKEIYKRHTIFLHPSILEAGHPNLTLLEAMASGLPTLATFEENNTLEGLIIIERDTDIIIKQLEWVIANYKESKIAARETAEELSWQMRTEELLKVYENKKSMKEQLIEIYNNTEKLAIKPKENFPNFNINFIDGAFAEVTGGPDGARYQISFIDRSTNELIHSDVVNTNSWVRTSRRYYTDWRVEIRSDKHRFIHDQDFKGKRVYIALDSSSLGDTLAWFPYVEEFAKRHQCKVVVSTFHNKFFKKTYPDLEFIEPGQVAHNIVAKYLIGWFYDSNAEPKLPATIPLQKTATNILGLEYKEIIPRIAFEPKARPYKEKYVCIATASTAGLKYWTGEGWTVLVNYLKGKDLRVIHISKEGTDLKVEQLGDTSMENTMNVLYHAEFLVGLSSGLSWLAWALGKKTVMISNFTEADHEFQTNCIRITDTTVCHGCWNDPKHTFDKGDWNWCPRHKGTARQFECHTDIKPQTVIKRIEAELLGS
jgi:autotransporter strand-loop-strand O-heptosyltransferase